MKSKILIFYAFTTVFLFWSTVSFSQKHKEKSLDSTLEANSEKWKVKQHQGIAGIAKPEFGNYTTLVAEKLDSPVIKKKRTDSSYIEGSFSGGGWDFSKYKTFEKKKFYRMILASGTDTFDLQFHLKVVSTEKRQALLSKMLSKNDENKDATVRYEKKIEGMIISEDSIGTAHFFIEDYVSTRQITYENPGQNEPITGGYILLKNDSLFTEPVMQTFGNPKSKFSRMFVFQMQKGIFMNDMNGTHIALLGFGDQPFYIWVRHDLDATRRDAVAAFFAIIIGVKDL
jgi:hypothetical protein